MATSPSSCPVCGQPLPVGAPQGLCPACLLRAGVPTGPAGAGPAKRGFTPPPPAELAPHFPQLEILELIGQGGMGAVYRARQPSLDRIVALKILPPQTGDDPGFAERFTREARALARINHPNIVAVHDFGLAGPYHYLLMEFVDGVNLRHLLNAGKIDPREALAIVPPICDALQYAHDHGIVHRDIKPENILLGKSGVVKLADFGLAKLAGVVPTDLTLTGDRDVMGTPHYMAPEQVERPLAVDHRADIYSLGVVFYQMLTGELPLGRFAPPSRKVRIDVRLDEVVLRALEKEPEQRYQQATALKTEVETIATTANTAGSSSISLSGRGVPPVGSENSTPTSRARPPSPAIAANGTDYRSRGTLWGMPLLHIATGIDPTTGKPRIARGIVAIGQRAHGVIAIGGLATGGIAIGATAIGVFACGGCAVGIVALGGLAIGALFGAGGLAMGSVVMGGTALGYLAYGNAAIGVQALGTNAADPAALAFFDRWAQPLLRSAIALAWGAAAALQGGVCAFVIHDLRSRGGLRQRWPVALGWASLVAFFVAVEGGLFIGWQETRYMDRKTIGPVASLSPPVRNRPAALRGYVIVQGWVVDYPATNILDAATFAAARRGARRDTTVRDLVAPLSLPSGGTLSTASVAFARGGQRNFGLKNFSATSSLPDDLPRVQTRVTPTEHGAGYRYTLKVTFSAGARLQQSETAAQAQPGSKQEISVSEHVAPNVPAILELGSFVAGRKLAVVFLFQSWTDFQQSERSVVNPADSRAVVAGVVDPGPGLPSPATSSPAPPANVASTLPEFDAMESNPEILRVLLRQAENQFERVRGLVQSGIGSQRDFNNAEERVGLLRAKLAGDLVGFATVQLTAAERRFTRVKDLHDAGIGPSDALASATAELEIARIRLQAVTKATPSAAPR